MNPALRTLIVLLSVSTGASASESLPAMQIGSADYARGSFPRNAAWLGLYCSDTGCALRPLVVSFEYAEALNVLDESEQTERLQVDDAPLAMFADSGLRPGVVETAYWQNDAPTRGPQKEQGRWTIPWPQGPLVLFLTVVDEGRSFRHDIASATGAQTLFTLEAEGHYGGDTSLPDIVWAGDIDRDGRLDLLLSLPDDNCAFDQRLYLSSRVMPGELLRLAAQHAGSLPACGC